MTQSISVYYLPVDTGTSFQTYHEAIVYDKGDGSTPTVIQAQPSIPFNGSDAQRNEVRSRITAAPTRRARWSTRATTGPVADRRSSDFNPGANITLETDYTGAGGTGTLTSADVNLERGRLAGRV